MKYIYCGALVVMLLVMFLMSRVNVHGANKEQAISVIRQASLDYRTKNSFNGECSIAGTPVSLSALMYGKLEQEGGWRDGTVGDRTSNRFSLHRSQGLFPTKGTIKADGTKKRPVYRNSYEGTYEAIHLLMTSKLYNGCNIGYKELKCYIGGCNAKDSATNPGRVIRGKKVTLKQFVTSKLNTLKDNALLFDQQKDSISDKPTTKAQKGKWDIMTEEKSCQFVTHTDLEYIQIDTLSGELVDQIVNPGGTLKVYKCKVNGNK